MRKLLSAGRADKHVGGFCLTLGTVHCTQPLPVSCMPARGVHMTLLLISCKVLLSAIDCGATSFSSLELREQ